MKHNRLLVAFILVCSMAFSLSLSAFADKEILYVNFGDSIAWGRIEDEDDFPDYNWEKGSYSGLFASYLGTERVSYARRGMQTTDILYMIDDTFRADVDNGVISPDKWHWKEYPPFDGTPLDKVKADTASADYITLCVGVCDYISFPDHIKETAMEDIPDTEELSATLKEYLSNGKLDAETYLLLSDIIEINKEKANVNVSHVFDILEGYADYVKYYPQIVKNLSELNENGTIILVGNYLPSDMASFLTESDEAAAIIPLLNRLLDNINLVAKEAAKEYDCVYVDTMGIESKWHPTVVGHQQICDRMISVLNGDKTYAGNVEVVTSIVDKFIEDISADIGHGFGFKYDLGKLFSSMKLFTNSILSVILDSIAGLFRGLGAFC